MILFSFIMGGMAGLILGFGVGCMVFHERGYQLGHKEGLEQSGFNRQTGEIEK